MNPIFKNHLAKISVLLLAAVCLISFVSCASDANRQSSETVPPTETTAETTEEEVTTEPLIIRTPINEGATMTPDIGKLNTPDPFITYDGMTDCYYAIYTAYSNVIIYRSKTLAMVFKDEIKVVYSVGNEVLADIWAPEMYFIDDKWYIYTSGTMAFDNTYIKHLFVLESNTSDPFDGFTYKACLSETLYAIDPTVYKDPESGINYICFSNCYDGKQWLSIAELENPWTMGEAVTVSSPTDYEWEHTDPSPTFINEGPFFVTSGNRLFIIYSANGCYNDDYCLGLLEWNGGDLLSKDSWVKYSEPVFSKTDSFYGTGHASFFKSPDNTETWIAYHCYFTPNDGSWRERYCRVQKIDFDSEGFPMLGIPLDKGAEIDVPSGE